MTTPQPDHVLASLPRLELRFHDEDERALALDLLGRYARECVDGGACMAVDGHALRWTDRPLFELAISELEEGDFTVRFPKSERMAWINSLEVVPYSATLYRGERRVRPEGFASDPGDLGTGRYLTTDEDTAAHYGPVGRHEVSYDQAVVAECADIIRHVNIFYRPCRGVDRVGGADTMRADFLEAGIEALVVHGYDSPDGHYTVVEFTSEPPRPTYVWKDPEGDVVSVPTP